MPMLDTQFDLNKFQEDIIKHHVIDMVFIEKVSAIQGAAAKATFNFGYGAGLIEGMIRAHQIPYRMIRPKEWQKFAHQGVDGKDAKEKSLNASMMRFPKETFLASKRSTKAHDGLVDAALICEYGISRYA